MTGDVALVVLTKVNPPDVIAQDKLEAVKSEALRENATRDFTNALLAIKDSADIQVNKRMLDR